MIAVRSAHCYLLARFNIKMQKFVIEPQRLMLNSIYFSFVGEEVMEKIASPLPGTERIAHCPGRCSNSLPPPIFSTRKVLHQLFPCRYPSPRQSAESRYPDNYTSCFTSAFSKALATLTIFSCTGHFCRQRPQPTQAYSPSLFSGKYTSLCI